MSYFREQLNFLTKELPGTATDIWDRTKSRLHIDCPAGLTPSALNRCRAERIVLLILFAACVFYLLNSSLALAGTLLKAAIAVAIGYVAWSRLG